MLITPSQALLILLNVHKHDELIYSELKRIFLLGAAGMSITALSKHFNDKHLKSYKISNHPELTKMDESRHYLETLLSNEGINALEYASEAYQSQVDNVLKKTIIFNEVLLQKVQRTKHMSSFDSSPGPTQATPKNTVQTAQNTEHSAVTLNGQQPCAVEIELSNTQHSSIHSQESTEEVLEIPREVESESANPLKLKAIPFSAVPTALLPSFYNLFTLSELYSSVILINKHLYQHAQLYTLRLKKQLELHLSKDTEDLRQDSLQDLSKEYVYFIELIRSLVTNPQSEVTAEQDSSSLIVQLNLPRTVDLITLLNSEPSERLQQLLTSEEIDSLEQNDLNDYRTPLNTIPGLIALLLNLITIEQVKAMPTATHLKWLLSNNGVKALILRLITPEAVAAIPGKFRVVELFRNSSGLIALDEELITLQQIETIYSNYIPYVLSYYGRLALSEGTVTFEQMSNMPTEKHLQYTLTKAVLEAVKKKIITVEQIYSISSELYLLTILTPECFYAIECGYVTFQQLMEMPGVGHIMFLIDKWGLVALKEELITIEGIKKLPTFLHASYLLSESGVQGMREKKISPLEASEMNSLALKEFLSTLDIRGQSAKASQDLSNEADVPPADALDVLQPPSKKDSKELLTPKQSEGMQKQSNTIHESYDEESIKTTISRAFSRYNAFLEDSKIGSVSPLARRSVSSDGYGYFTWLRHGFFRGGLKKASVFNQCFGEHSKIPFSLSELRKQLLSQHANHRHSFASYVLDELREIITEQNDGVPEIQPLPNGRYSKEQVDEIFKFLGLDGHSEKEESVRDEWIKPL